MEDLETMILPNTEALLGALARGYTDHKSASKELDADLLRAQEKHVRALLNTYYPDTGQSSFYLEHRCSCGQRIVVNLTHCENLTHKYTCARCERKIFITWSAPT